jgi:MFS family permease
MTDASKRKISVAAQIAMLLVGFYAMADMFIVSPLLGEIELAFPDASSTTVQMCYAISQFTILLSTLLCIPLVKRISKKSIMLIGMLLVAFGGGLGAIVDNINYMLVMRSVEGFGAGFLITLIPVVIAELCDEYKTQQLIGWQAAVGCGLGSACAALSGTWAVMYGWQTGYFLYFFSLVIFFMVLFFVPKTPPDRPDLTDNATRNKPKINKKVIVWAIAIFFFAILTNCMFLFEASYIQQTGVGDAALAGTTQSFITLASAVAGIVMAALCKRLRTLTEPFCWLMLTIGAIITTIGISFGIVPFCYIGCLIFGFGYGTFFPWMYAKTTMIASPGTETQSMSMINCAYYIGMFSAVYFYLGVGTIANNSTPAFSFRIMIIASIIMLAIFLISGIRSRYTEKSAKLKDPVS